MVSTQPVRGPRSDARSRVHTVHQETIDAPAHEVYELVADVTRWPYTFGPTVDVRVLEGAGPDERLRLWATANGAVRSWTSRRSLDPVRLHVRFRQERSASPVLEMGGEWRIRALDVARTRVELLHDFTTASADDDALVGRAVDTNSTAELGALRRAAELGSDRERLVRSFSDSVDVRGRADVVREFLRDAAAWPRRLPHVARLDLSEDVPGVQVMEMDTRTTDGTLHTTHSIRVCHDGGDIAYKQTVPPEVMSAHVGRWTVRENDDGTVRATSHHTVVLRPEKITELLGPEGTVGGAAELVRAALGTNSRATLRAAQEFAESQADPPGAAR